MAWKCSPEQAREAESHIDWGWCEDQVNARPIGADQSGVVEVLRAAITTAVGPEVDGYMLDCEHYREQIRQADALFNLNANERSTLRRELSMRDEEMVGLAAANALVRDEYEQATTRAERAQSLAERRWAWLLIVCEALEKAGCPPDSGEDLGEDVARRLRG